MPAPDKCMLHGLADLKLNSFLMLCSSYCVMVQSMYEQAASACDIYVSLITIILDVTHVMDILHGSPKKKLRPGNDVMRLLHIILDFDFVPTGLGYM